MAYTQLRTPNLSITYTGGWCLKAVEDSFGTEHWYPSAMDSWNANNGDHQGEQPPSGVAVPVYFSLGSTPAGHIAISLPDGRVASSTQEGVHQGLYIHPSLADLINVYADYNQGCQYLGWSERLADTQIVADQGAAPDMDPHQIAKDLYQAFTGSVPGDDIINQKADFIAGTNSVQQVATDIAAAGGWKNDPDWNHSALVSYRGAFAIPNDNADQWASERQQGGETFDSQVHKELPPILAQSSQAAGLTAQLQTEQANEADLNRQIKSLTSQVSIAQDTIAHLQKQLEYAQQPASEQTAPNTQPSQNDASSAPTAPQVVAQGPVATKPSIQPAKKSLWQQFLSLFINF